MQWYSSIIQLPVHRRNAVFSVQFSSCGNDVLTTRGIACDHEMVALVLVDSYKDSAPVLETNLVEMHARKRLLRRERSKVNTCSLKKILLEFDDCYTYNKLIANKYNIDEHLCNY